RGKKARIWNHRFTRIHTDRCFPDDERGWMVQRRQCLAGKVSTADEHPYPALCISRHEPEIVAGRDKSHLRDGRGAVSVPAASPNRIDSLTGSWAKLAAWQPISWDGPDGLPILATRSRSQPESR